MRPVLRRMGVALSGPDHNTLFERSAMAAIRRPKATIWSLTSAMASNIPDGGAAIRRHLMQYERSGHEMPQRTSPHESQ